MSMNIVLTKARIQGSAKAIFDLITTAKYWPEWHPSTISVGGVVDHPYKLGDQIFQHARIGGWDYKSSWTVSEHRRPQRVTLQIDNGRIEIRYTLDPGPKSTMVVRRLAYRLEDFTRDGNSPHLVEQIMHDESEKGLQQLKLLAESIL